MSELATLRARLHGVRLLTAAIRLQLAIKANFNPNQPRVPAGQTDGGQWANGDGLLQLVADKPPPLRRLHPDSTYERDQIAKGSLEHWRQQPTDKIVESLKPGADEPLRVKPDGSVWQGNTRIKVLQERGYDVDSLPRVPYNDAPPKPPRRGGRGGGGGGIGPPFGAGRFPRI